MYIKNEWLHYTYNYVEIMEKSNTKNKFKTTKAFFMEFGVINNIAS